MKKYKIREANRKPPFKLKVKRSNTGLGLFAEEDIPKGKFIIEYIGEVIDNDEMYRRDAKNAKYLFTIDDKLTVDGAPRENTARYINHACKPNCEPYTYAKRIYIRSLKKIKAGDELNYDYGEDYIDGHFGKENCMCKSCEKKRNKKTDK